ncbi:MAG: hypothetical protein HQL66_10735 [Magnetococcales bacterium]|nr:hypothetical protein [Magnetococcales bacterium]
MEQQTGKGMIHDGFTIHAVGRLGKSRRDGGNVSLAVRSLVEKLVSKLTAAGDVAPYPAAVDLARKRLQEELAWGKWEAVLDDSQGGIPAFSGFKNDLKTLIPVDCVAWRLTDDKNGRVLYLSLFSYLNFVSAQTGQTKFDVVTGISVRGEDVGSLSDGDYKHFTEVSDSILEEYMNGRFNGSDMEFITFVTYDRSIGDQRNWVNDAAAGPDSILLLRVGSVGTHYGQSAANHLRLSGISEAIGGMMGCGPVSWDRLASLLPDENEEWRDYVGRFKALITVLGFSGEGGTRGSIDTAYHQPIGKENVLGVETGGGTQFTEIVPCFHSEKIDKNVKLNELIHGFFSAPCYITGEYRVNSLYMS